MFNKGQRSVNKRKFSETPQRYLNALIYEELMENSQKKATYPTAFLTHISDSKYEHVYSV